MTMRWFTWCAASITLLAFLAPGRVLAANVYFVDYTFESFPDGSFRDRFSLSRVNADGTGREEVVHDMGPQPQYAGLVVEKGVVYWNGFDNVTRAATTAGVLLGPTSPPNPRVGAEVIGRAIDAAGVHTYFPERNQFNQIDRIVRADFEYGNPVTFVPTRDFEPNLSIALDEPAGKIYWAGSWGGDKAGLVQRANLSDGSHVETLLENFTSDDYTVDLALDLAAGKMYLGNSSLKLIQRANLNGSGLETIVTDTYVFAMALDTTVPEATGVLVVGAGACWALGRRRR